MIQHSDILVIGAGAAGMMAAISAPGSIVLEKMPRPARKIMITGKGRCNFTNIKGWEDFSRHIHPKANVLKAAFHSLTPENLFDMFGNAGLECVVERGDRAFPASHKAVDVVDTLAAMVRKAGSRILCGQSVTETGRDGDGFFVHTADGNCFRCRKLIVTCGGLSYPATGSDGDGYRFAAGFGHSITPLHPSLTALVPAGYKALAPYTTNSIPPDRLESVPPKGGVRAYSARSQSDFLAPYTTNSIPPDRLESVPPKGGVRAYSARSQSDFLAPYTTNSIPPDRLESCRHHIHRDTPLGPLGKRYFGHSMKNVTLSLLIDGVCVQEEFGDLEFTDGGLEGPVGYKISRKAVIALENGGKVSVRISFGGGGQPLDFNISGFVGYERAVVTAGGICTNEIIPKTMESRLVKGLYFAGEVLDIDCDTGGYNLHAAFCTGHLAGESAARRG